MIGISDTDLGKPLSAKRDNALQKSTTSSGEKDKKEESWAIYWGWSMFSVGQMDQLAKHKFNLWG